MEHSAWTDERLDNRFAQIDRRFDQVDQRFDRVDREIADLRTEMRTGLTELRQAHHRLNINLWIAGVGLLAAIIVRGA